MKPAPLLFFFILTACGSGGGSGGSGSLGACYTSFNRGTWLENGGASDEYHFIADCTGTNLNCGLEFTWVNVGTDDLADIPLHVTASNNGGGCPTVGQNINCDWSTPGAGQIILNCGGGNIQFSKTSEN